ncbi:MAG: TetR family transcriptional regulator [Actinobacteria bacterium]|nr:TetR family transcriptional regulator [Actinomycetota bacterium]
MSAAEMRGMRMGELARRSGTDKQLIHYYLRKGYLNPPLYKKGNQAMYGNAHLEKLVYLRRSREEGLPLSYASELWERERGEPQPTQRRVRRGEGESPTRERIIREATAVFLRKGYRGATISEIMESVGSSKASFYYYFANKKDLYFACLDIIFQNVFRDALDDIRREEDMIKRLELRWGATRAFFPEMITILQLVRDSLRDEDEGHRLQAAAILRRSLIEPLAGDLEKGMQDGVLRQVRSEIIPFAIISMLEMVAYRSMIDERYSDADIEDSVLDLILNGILANKA